MRGSADADTQVPAGESLMLALRGRPLHVEDQRVVAAFAAQAAVILERHRLTEAAAAAGPLAEADKTRTALLAAVGHDLRSPLASAKAAVSSLRSDDVPWTPSDRRELLTTADESLDQLARLVDNLLDMSRLRADALTILNRPVALDEVVPLALDALGPKGSTVIVDVPDDLPVVQADAGLLERVIANLVGNAIRYSPPDRPPVITGSGLGERVELRIIDRGPGIPSTHLDQVFTPFQRLGDTDNTTGIGLGLALSRGLTEAMGGSLAPEETPGGGLTMVVSLPDPHRVPPASGAMPNPDTASEPPTILRSPANGSAHDTCSRRRRRTADPASAEHQPRARHYDVVTAATGTEALAPPRPGHRTSSSSTSDCPTSTASRSCADCAGGAPRPSSSSPGAAEAPTRSARSTPGPTTT